MSGVAYEGTLKPCPFCGGKGIVWRAFEFGCPEGVVRAFCGKHCGVGLSIMRPTEPDAEKRLARKWNKRPLERTA